MAFRLLQYSVHIMAQHLKANKSKKLPLVLPLVYYCGKPTKKSFKTNIVDCFDNPVLAKKYFMKPFNVIDLNKLSDNRLLQDKALAGLELLQKHLYARNLAQALDVMLEKGVFVAMHQFDGEYLYAMIKYLVNTGEIKQPKHFFEKLEKQFPGDKKIMTIAETLRKEGRKQGLRQGIEQGMEQGTEKAKVEIAKNLLTTSDLSIEKIAAVTNLSKAKIESLKTVH